jgi:hypothetical protein
VTGATGVVGPTAAAAVTAKPAATTAAPKTKASVVAQGEAFLSSLASMEASAQAAVLKELGIVTAFAKAHVFLAGLATGVVGTIVGGVAFRLLVH